MGGLRISRNTKKDSIAEVAETQEAPREEAATAEQDRPAEAPVTRRRRSLQDRRHARARFDAENKKPKIVEIKGTDGDDRISVSRQKDGRVRVDHNGRVQTYDRNTQLYIAAG